MTEAKREYRSLDTDENRRALVSDMKRIRQEALRLINLVPKDKWYEPRYHGWSPAAMMSHLHSMDNLTLSMMQAAMRGVALPVPKSALNLFNNVMSRVFKTRNMEATLLDIQKNEARLIAFVLRLTPDQFQHKLYDPWLECYLTVEESVQEFFFIHWEGHLQTVRDAEDKGFYEPPASPQNV